MKIKNNDKLKQRRINRLIRKYQESKDNEIMLQLGQLNSSLLNNSISETNYMTSYISIRKPNHIFI